MIKISSIFTALSLTILLAACGENSDESTVATALEVEVTQATTTSSATVEIGMTEKAVANLLGAPQSTQTRTIEALTVTHSEWSDESGTTSIQFINGEVKFHHFFTK